MPLPGRLQDGADTLRDERDRGGDGHVGQDVRGVDPLDLGGGDEARLHEPLHDSIEDRLLFSVGEERLPKIAEGGVVEGALIEAEPESVLHLDVVAASPRHLSVRKGPVELEDGGARQEGGRDRGTARVGRGQRGKLCVGDQWRDDHAEPAGDAVGGNEGLTDLVGIGDAALVLRGRQHPGSSRAIGRLLSYRNIGRRRPLTRGRNARKRSPCRFSISNRLAPCAVHTR